MPPQSGQTDPSSDPRSDAALIAAAAHPRGRPGPDAFHILYLRHRAFVYRVALRYARDHAAALDASQDAFLHLIARIPTLCLTGKLTTYLYPVVKNFALARTRAGNRHLRLLSALLPRPGGGGAEVAAATDGGGGLPAAPQPASDSTLDPALSRALDALAPEHREVLLMRIVDNLSVSEVAQALTIPEGTVKSRLHHALNQLRSNPALAHLHD